MAGVGGRFAEGHTPGDAFGKVRIGRLGVRDDFRMILWAIDRPSLDKRSARFPHRRIDHR